MMQRLARLKPCVTFWQQKVTPGAQILLKRPDSSTSNSNWDNFLAQKCFPKEEEAQQLQNLFPNAKEVVGEIFAPFKKSEETLLPTLETDRSSKTNICKTKMKLNWPVKTDVLGTHVDEDKSVENAYLIACSLLQNLGLLKITEQGASQYTIDEIVDILEYLAVKQDGSRQVYSNFKMVNLLHYHEDDVLWSSSLQVSWPLNFTITSEAQTMNLALYKTCLRTAMKLKTVGCFDQENHMKKGILLGLDKYDVMANDMMARNFADPDYEMFVDSSEQGMGAYLINKEDDKILWICDHWEEVQKHFLARQTSYNEFYALVTACYTWKHKFIGKKILCYSDNLFSVNLVNHGLLVFADNPSSAHDSYKKLYLLLSEVCDKFNITVVGVHVPRKINVAADLLSRLDVTNFKDIVPTAFETPMKLKKLWFSDHAPPPIRSKNNKTKGKHNDGEKPDDK